MNPNNTAFSSIHSLGLSDKDADEIEKLFTAFGGSFDQSHASEMSFEESNQIKPQTPESNSKQMLIFEKSDVVFEEKLKNALNEGKNVVFMTNMVGKWSEYFVAVVK